MSSSESSEVDSLRSDESVCTDEEEEEVDLLSQLSLFWPYPKGPDASLRKGPSLANLSQRKVLCKGPNPENRRGPDPTLRNGPDPKNHSGIKWRADCQNLGSWKGPKADIMLKQKKRRKRQKHSASHELSDRTGDEDRENANVLEVGGGHEIVLTRKETHV